MTAARSRVATLPAGLALVLEYKLGSTPHSNAGPAEDFFIAKYDSVGHAA